MSDISSFAEWEDTYRTLQEELDSQEQQRKSEMSGLEYDSSNDPHSDREEDGDFTDEVIELAGVDLEGMEDAPQEGQGQQYGIREIFPQEPQTLPRIHIPEWVQSQSQSQSGGRKGERTKVKKRVSFGKAIEYKIPAIESGGQSEGEDERPFTPPSKEDFDELAILARSPPADRAEVYDWGRDEGVEELDVGGMDERAAIKEGLCQMTILGPSPTIEHGREQIEREKWERHFGAAGGREDVRQMVSTFVREHVVFTDARPGEDEELEFKNDVYRFARKAGMGRNAAKIEVLLAKARLYKAHGAGNGLVLEMSEDSESELGEEVRSEVLIESPQMVGSEGTDEDLGRGNCTGPTLTDAKDYYPAIAEVQTFRVQVEADGAESGGNNKKRKLALTDEDREKRDAKRLKKREKKVAKQAKAAERVAKKAEKLSKRLASASRQALAHGESSETPGQDEDMEDELALAPSLQINDAPEDIEDRYVEMEMASAIPSMHPAPASIPKETAKKKRAKPGPTTSRHFAKTAGQVNGEEKSGDAGNAIDGPKMNRKKKRKLAKLVAQKLLPEMGDPATAEGTSIPEDPEFGEQLEQVTSNATSGSSKRTRRRNRNRNKNRLAEEKSSASKSSDAQAQQIEDGSAAGPSTQQKELRAEKELRTQEFVETLVEPDVPTDAVDPIALTIALTQEVVKEKKKKEKRQKMMRDNNEEIEDDYAEPLAELQDTNSKGKRRSRRTGGKSPPLVEEDQESASGDHLLDLQDSIPIIQALEDLSPMKPPRSTVQVVLYTPSKTWAAPDAVPSVEAPDLKAMDQGSVLDMSDHGSVNWDESDDDRTWIARKTRRRSSLSLSHEQAFAFSKPKPNPKKVANAAKQVRNRGGQFASRDPSTSSRGRKRATSIGPSTRRLSAQPRDAKGRFGSVTKSLPSASDPGRDSHGRWKAKSEAAPILPPMSSNGRRTSSASSSIRRPVSQSRDARGRFGSAIKSEPSATDLSRDEYGRSRSKSESAPILPPRNPSIPPEAVPVSTQMPEAKLEETGKYKKSTKPKRPPAKSPYFSPATTPSKSKVKKERKEDPADRASSQPRTPRTPKEGTPSTTPKRARTPAGTVSCIPFPPLSSPTFGLIQEKLATDPFRLLIAVTFLIRTHGKHAIPVFFTLMSKYPTPASLSSAPKADIIDLIRHLGLQNQRAGTYQSYANTWLENPPTKEKRYSVKGYAVNEEGKEEWEIGHMTQGPYALDSWRIFCRDELRGVAEGWNGEGTKEGFQPEWMRVLPEDKELRAFLRWMWLKEGFEWDPWTGEKEVAGERVVRAAMEGRMEWDDKGGVRIVEKVEEVGDDDGVLDDLYTED